MQRGINSNSRLSALKSAGGQESRVNRRSRTGLKAASRPSNSEGKGAESESLGDFDNSGTTMRGVFGVEIAFSGSSCIMPARTPATSSVSFVITSTLTISRAKFCGAGNETVTRAEAPLPQQHLDQPQTGQGALLEIGSPRARARDSCGLGPFRGIGLKRKPSLASFSMASRNRRFT